jgi:hypothetical protein
VIKLLARLGLDLPAKVASARAYLEQQIEAAASHAGEVTRETAVVGALYACAALAAVAAFAMGLIALYLWIASQYGVYAGLGAVAGCLIFVALILTTIAASRRRSFAARQSMRWLPPPPPPAADVRPAMNAGTMESSAPITAISATPSAADLVEPLALLLSEFGPSRASGNPAVDEVLAGLRGAARGTASEAIARAANVIREGDRLNVIFVLSTAAVVGWLDRKSTRLNSSHLVD